MRPAVADRWLTLGIAALGTCCCACLAVGYSSLADPAGPTMLSAAAASLAAVAVAARIPRLLARAVQAVLGLLGLQSGAAIGLAAVRSGPSGPGSLRAVQRMLALSAAVLAAGAAASMAIRAVAPDLLEALSADIAVSTAEWRLVVAAVQFVGLLGPGVGLAMAYLVATVLRESPSEDYYAIAVREILLGAAAGLVLFAVLWRAGADLNGSVAVLVVVLVGVAALVARRPEVTVRPRRNVRPVENGPVRRRGLKVAAGAAAAVGGLLVQARLAQDAFGLDGGWIAAWMGASLALTAGMLSRIDHSARHPDRREGYAACLGAVGCLGLQAVLAATAVYLPGWLWAGPALLAATAQLPLTALTATVLWRDRRDLVESGGRSDVYLFYLAGGGAAGVAVFVVLLASGLSVILALVAVLLAGTFAAIGAILHSESPARQAGLAVGSVVLVASLQVAALRAYGRACEARGLLRPGPWLTAVIRPRAGRAVPRGVLPAGPPERSEAITALLGTLADGLSGRRWGLVLCDGSDWPARTALPEGAVVAPVSPSISLAGSFPPPHHSASASVHVAAAGLVPPGRFCEGLDVLYWAPMPLDHPQAWRCYAMETLLKCRRCLAPRGVFVLRSQLPADRPNRLPVLAETVRRVFSQAGTGRIWTRSSDGRTDVLLVVGPLPPELDAELTTTWQGQELATFCDSAKAGPVRFSRPNSWPSGP